MDEPTVTTVAGKLSITLVQSTPVRTTPFECVLDFDDLGAVIGVEILAFREQLGVIPPPSPAAEGPTFWSYDDEMDAFYLHVQRGTAPRQKKKTGRASVDNDGVIVELEIPL